MTEFNTPADPEIKFLDAEEEGSREKPLFMTGTGGEAAYTSFMNADSSGVNYCFKFRGVVFKISPDANLTYLDDHFKGEDTDDVLSEVKDSFIEVLSKKVLNKK